MLEKFIYPAVLVMNKLPFKLKIILSISILFTLLIIPSRTTFKSYIEKSNRYSNQLVGLKYSRLIHNLIIPIQIHRGLLNGYLQGNYSFEKDILKSEKDIKKNLLNLIEYDRKSLKVLKHNKKFVDAISRYEVIEIKNLSISNNSDKVFKVHNEMITMLIKSLNKISNLTSFSNTNDKKIIYISNMLKEKLLLLEDNLGQIRGLATGIFTNKKISKEQKNRLLSKYTEIKSLESYLLDNSVLTPLSTYMDIEQKIVLSSYQLTGVLNIVNNNIFMTSAPKYDAKSFFKKATDVINLYSTLYNILADNYNDLVQKKKRELLKEMFFLIAGFLVILFSASYIFLAFYNSIAHSLKKLQTASNMIARGESDIHLKVDTKDEIGDALLAFNNMSHKLNENISFLDGYKMAIDETSIVSKTNPKGIITYVNKLFCQISGFKESELIGLPHNIVRHQDMPKEAFKDLWKTIKAKKVWKGIVKNRKKGGGYYIVDATIIPVLDADGEIVEYIGVRHDITELEKSKEEIKKQRIDLLTGLSNRNQLMEDIKLTKKPVMLYLNIDEFTALNEFYGHKIADLALIHVATLLKSIAKVTKSKLYKLHSDKFLLLFEEGDINRKNYHKIVMQIIEYIETETVNCDSKNCVTLTITGGLAFYDTFDSYENLLTFANTARKTAIAENKKYKLYNSKMNKDADYQSNIEWISKIKDAIENDKIVPYFQPIIDNSNGYISKYESLIRLIDNNGEAISPYHFLNIAKNAKLSTQLTKIIIDKTFKTFENLPKYEFSINLTIEDILDGEISSYIFTKLSSYKNSNRVILEITESQEIKDYSVVNEFIKIVKNKGAKIAIDDFGSGYANFEHILALNVDYIKLDGSLIKNIDRDPNSKIITEAIIAFSKKLGCKTIVEYVHNQKIQNIVKELGANYSQGYHIGKPTSEIKVVRSKTLLT